MLRNAASAARLSFLSGLPADGTSLALQQIGMDGKQQILQLSECADLVKLCNICIRLADIYDDSIDQIQDVDILVCDREQEDMLDSQAIPVNRLAQTHVVDLRFQRGILRGVRKGNPGIKAGRQ